SRARFSRRAGRAFPPAAGEGAAALFRPVGIGFRHRRLNWNEQQGTKSMTGNASIGDAATELSATFSGQVLRSGDVEYEDARKVHNGLIDKRPALIARCRGTADVVNAVNFACAQGLEVAIFSAIGWRSQTPIDASLGQSKAMLRWSPFLPRGATPITSVTTK